MRHVFNPRFRRGDLVLLLSTYVLIFILGFFIAVLLNVSDQQGLQHLEMSGPLGATANVVAARNDGTGSIGEMSVEIRQGEGRILFDTNPFSIPDIQFSAQKAVSVTQTYTKKNLGNKDIIVSFDVEGGLIGGESAGAAMASAMIAAIDGKTLKQDVAITGTIETDGSIGPVAGIPEKIQAAAGAGIKVFLLPKGQLEMAYYVPMTRTEEVYPGFFYDKNYYVRKTLNLRELGAELGLDVIEVQDIRQALTYLFA
ncbi:MAG: hypothetical protein JXB14_05510 [Candidatus Altiarchaeota archaeon]|nr:hypothetical protein [Candidatus Altiarchaeota archaeon]